MYYLVVMNLKKNFGNKIREIRIKRALTQEALAEKINISAKSLSQIELGNNFVSAETLNSLCIALDVNPKTLFDFDYIETQKEITIEEVDNKLKNNPKLLKTVYNIISILDY